MTATEMLTEALNGVLRRPIVNGPELRYWLIKWGIVKPQGRWVYVPSKIFRGAKLVWIPTVTS